MKEFYHIIKYLILFAFLYISFINWKREEWFFETIIEKVILFIMWIIIGFLEWVIIMILIAGVLSISWGNVFKEFFQWVINL